LVLERHQRMTLLSRFRQVTRKFGDLAQSATARYRLIRPERNEKAELGFCSTCGNPITLSTQGEYSSFHNAATCRLVNLALVEMEVSIDQTIRVVVYPYWGPLKGYYSTAEPLTIHVAEETYSHFPEYIIFHETKHLVDCLTKGWSEEGTPDPFARHLCAKYDFPCPPPHQHIGQ